MPRPPRLIVPDGIYHVMSRGVKQCRIFQEDCDRLDFLQLVRLMQEDEPYILHAYCLMGNHYHLLLQPTEGSISKIMQGINSVYSSRYNLRHALTGHVLQGRFHSIPVESDAYLTTVSRYIHLNPVRAGLIGRPEDYRWSNYREMITGEADSLADTRFILGYFGFNVGRQRRAYQRFVEDGLTLPEPITESVLWRMRQWGQPLKRSLSLNELSVVDVSQPVA